ncbi:MAG: class I SAM-dependent methyltransferase [Candidatus Omnitrophica bacterium]|jgi:2-polyprenyl-3-methyl-5-hydroxy-6-metoxy-1,4-benzoquinol methylase|nr:class I SAM-dependent methyltransferase [Candidatus Omnitrophota bacterium]
MEKKYLLNCPVCENKNWSKVYHINLWDIEECGKCGFAKINPLPSRDNRQLCYSKEEVVARNAKKKSFSRDLSRAMKRFFSKITKRNKSEIFYNKLRKHLSPQAKILDIGCGDGSFLRLAKGQFSCAGIEISEYLASLARTIDGADIKWGNFLDTEFKGETYDAITLISLLEHLDDPFSALKKCFNLLNKNGILLLKTVNYGCLNRKIKKEKWTGFRPPDHVVYFSPHNLSRILEGAGFSKIKVKAWPFNDNMYCDAFKYTDDRRF